MLLRVKEKMSDMMHFFTSWHVSATFLERATIPVTSFPGCCHKTNFGSLPFLSGLYEINNKVKILTDTPVHIILYMCKIISYYLTPYWCFTSSGFSIVLWTFCSSESDNNPLKSKHRFWESQEFILYNIHRVLESFTKWTIDNDRSQWIN